jgi:hypothetical protein
MEGETLAPPPIPSPRKPDDEWLARHRSEALSGVAAAGMKGFAEICHFLPDSVISKSQLDLLSAARQAQVQSMGWPMGTVLDREDSRPRSTNEGIVANVLVEIQSAWGLRRAFQYWTLGRGGDFYALASLPEDDGVLDPACSVICFDIRIFRAAEILQHCVNLYRALGIDPNDHVELKIKYGGLRGRRLTSASPGRYGYAGGENTLEDTVTAAVRFRLDAVESLLVETVQKLCEPLFVVFDFASFPDERYRQIVADFLSGKIS